MVKMKKALTFALATALVGAIGVGSTLAYLTDSDSAVNTVTTGRVDITLWETSENGEEKVDSLSFEDVLPGDHLKKDPTVTVESGSQDSYLRVAVGIDSLKEEKLTDSQLTGIWSLITSQISENGWSEGLSFDTNTVSGDVKYYYYQPSEGVATVGDYNIFDGIDVPSEWENEYADLSFTISLYAEAIQARNFTPARDDNGSIISWTEVPSVSAVSLSIDSVEVTLTDDDNDGYVIIPESAIANGYINFANNYVYAVGDKVAVTEIENAALTSQEVKKYTFTAKYNDKTSKTYVAEKEMTIVVPVISVDFNISNTGSVKSNIYTSAAQIRAAVPELEGYTLSDNNAVMIQANGSTKSNFTSVYAGGDVWGGLVYNKTCKQSTGPNKYVYEEALCSIKQSGGYNYLKLFINGTNSLKATINGNMAQ